MREQLCAVFGAVLDHNVFVRDEGDCNSRFLHAESDAELACDRDFCSTADQDYSNGGPCFGPCFKASCDWSKSMCAAAHANIGACPLFDAASYVSLAFNSTKSVRYILGGSARCCIMYILAFILGTTADLYS